MKLDINKQIKKLVNEIVNSIQAEEIILFGSYAYGNPDRDSDIDLCILTNDMSKRKIDLIREVRKAITPVAVVPVDILIYGKREFANRSGLNTTLEYKIKNEGISIYGQ